MASAKCVVRQRQLTHGDEAIPRVGHKQKQPRKQWRPGPTRGPGQPSFSFHSQSGWRFAGYSPT